jgi:hypothetical protein
LPRAVEHAQRLLELLSKDRDPALEAVLSFIRKHSGK